MQLSEGQPYKNGNVRRWVTIAVALLQGIDDSVFDSY